MEILHFLLLFAGLVLLVKGSDYFVKAASNIAKRFGISEFVIGLTLVAIGTSIPELASSIAAALNGASGLVVGNIIGSNIANIGLIVGIAAFLSVIKTSEEVLKKDGYIMLFSAVVFFVFISDSIISFVEAIVLVLFYIAYIAFLFEEKPKRKGDYHFREFLDYFFGFRYITKAAKAVQAMDNGRGKKKPVKGGGAGDVPVLVLGGAAIIFGAHFFIGEAIYFSGLLGIPETIIGISMVAVGTSLPELMVTISAARHGHANIALGNVIGSNISNTFFVLGVSGLVYPITVAASTGITTLFMVLMSILLLVFVKSNWELRKNEGLLLLALYFAFLFGVFLLP